MNISRWVTAIVIVVTVIAGLGFIKFSQIQAAIAFGNSFPEPSASVMTEETQVTDYQPQLKVTGQLQAVEHINISNEYAGRITEVNFQPGELVKKGQVLLRQDTSVETASLAAAKARLKLAKSSLSRLNKLVVEDKVSQEEVDQASANVAISQAEVDNLTSVINKKTVRAPFSGRLGLTQYQVGQLLSPSAMLTTLTGVGQDIWVDFNVPQTLPQLTTGDTVLVKVIGSQGKATPIEATVIAQNAAIDQNSRQLQYRAVLANSYTLNHNQIVSVVINQPLQKVITVPSSAITRNHLGEFVFVLKLDDKKQLRAHSVKVSLGERIQDLQIVHQGLNVGDLIATEGAFKLTDNLLVYPGNETVSLGAK